MLPHSRREECEPWLQVYRDCLRRGMQGPMIRPDPEIGPYGWGVGGASSWPGEEGAVRDMAGSSR